MTKVETPAESLNHLIRRCLECNQSGNVVQALMEISDAVSNEQLLQFISIADGLIIKIRKIIEISDLDEDQRSDVRAALDCFREIFKLELMYADWRSVRVNSLPPHHVQTLKMLGPGIKSVASHHELSSVEIKELEDEAGSLFDSIQDSDLDDDVKRLILSHIRLVLFHLANYRIGGKKALRSAVSYIAGDIMTFYDDYKVNPSAENGRGFFRFIGSVINRLRASSDDVERLERMPKDLEMIADLFGKGTS